LLAVAVVGAGLCLLPLIIAWLGFRHCHFHHFVVITIFIIAHPPSTLQAVAHRARGGGCWVVGFVCVVLWQVQVGMTCSFPRFHAVSNLTNKENKEISKV
jgi:hypothetical protein